MKKFFTILCMAFLCITLTACGGGEGEGSSIPEGMSEDSYKAGENLLEVVEDYISGDKTASEAYDKSKDLVSRFSEDEDHNTNMLRMSAEIVARELLQPNPDLDSIKSERDEIKSSLGK